MPDDTKPEAAPLDKKLIENTLLAGFQAGWATACEMIAGRLEEDGAPRAVVAQVRILINKPPTPEIDLAGEDITGITRVLFGGLKEEGQA